MDKEVQKTTPDGGMRDADPLKEERNYITNVYNPSRGDVIGGYQLMGQLDVVSAEADLWVAENNGHEYICKLYRHGVNSCLVSSGLLLSLDHPHLLPTKATGEHLGRQYEIAPFYAYGSLEKVLAGGGKMSLSDAAILVEQLSMALAYLHQQGIQHRDIKPANILVRQMKPLDVIMSDFGRSEESSTTMLTMSRATLLYSAPEAVNGMFSTASDWWSLGMVLLEALMGRHPLSHLPPGEQHYAIVAGDIQIPGNGAESDPIPPHWQALLHGLLACDYTQRWGADQVAEWLQQTKAGWPIAATYPSSITPYRKKYPPLAIVLVSLPLIVIATRYLGPIVEQFLGLLFLLWLTAILGSLGWKALTRR